jgi:hypothetical protein
MKLNVGDLIKLEGWKGIYKIERFEKSLLTDSENVIFSQGMDQWVYPLGYLRKRLQEFPDEGNNLPCVSSLPDNAYPLPTVNERELKKFTQKEKELSKREVYLCASEEFLTKEWEKLRACEKKLEAQAIIIMPPVQFETMEETIARMKDEFQSKNQNHLKMPESLSIRDQLLIALKNDEINPIVKEDFNQIIQEKKVLTSLEFKLLGTLIERMGWGI